MTRVGIIVQARMGSTRLPGKVLEDLAGAPALLRLFERLRRVRGNPLIVLATSKLPGDDPIADLVATQSDIALWRGPEQDVLKRYAGAARYFDLDPIIRITADCRRRARGSRRGPESLCGEGFRIRVPAVPRAARVSCRRGQ